MKKHTLLLALLLLLTSGDGWSQESKQASLLTGPILYGILPDGELYKIDVMNCTACLIANFNISPALDLVVLPNGDILVQASGLLRYSLPNTNPIWTGSPNFGYEGSILAPNGTVYLSRFFPTAGLSIYDPANNSVVYVGDWPPNMVLTEFFYQNGILYALGGLNLSGVVVQVNISNPALSTVVQSGIQLDTGGATDDGYTTALGSFPLTTLNQYNVNTNTLDFVCDLSAFTGSVGFTGLSSLPAGVQAAPCLCTTFAGTVNNQVINTCVPGSVTVPYNNDATLEGNDILRYILFSNTSDTLGSIIVQSSSPEIEFNAATMQLGIPYYLATIAGNHLGGNVDFNDPCLDISNVAARVIWREKPAVAFSIAGDPNVCAGACRTVTANFTGAAPFALTYTTSFGTFSASFPANNGTFELCVPPAATPGVLDIQAIGLTDAWCNCN